MLIAVSLQAEIFSFFNKCFCPIQLQENSYETLHALSLVRPLPFSSALATRRNIISIYVPGLKSSIQPSERRNSSPSHTNSAGEDLVLPSEQVLLRENMTLLGGILFGAVKHIHCITLMDWMSEEERGKQDILQADPAGAAQESAFCQVHSISRDSGKQVQAFLDTVPDFPAASVVNPHLFYSVLFFQRLWETQHLQALAFCRHRYQEDHNTLSSIISAFLEISPSTEIPREIATVLLQLSKKFSFSKTQNLVLLRLLQGVYTQGKFPGVSSFLASNITHFSASKKSAYKEICAVLRKELDSYAV